MNILCNIEPTKKLKQININIKFTQLKNLTFCTQLESLTKLYPPSIYNFNGYAISIKGIHIILKTIDNKETIYLLRKQIFYYYTLYQSNFL